MDELFKTVLILSGLGFGLTAILLILKPLTLKKFPARWQYWVWIAVMVSMLVPVYKLIPKQEAQKFVYTQKAEVVLPEATSDRVYTYLPDAGQQAIVREQPDRLTQKQKTSLWSLAAYIWGLGLCIYILVIITSYAVYISKKRKTSADVTDCAMLDSVKKELKIKRKIKLRTSETTGSPLLVGLFRPTIYIPQRAFDDENMRMIFLHELTHCKRGDLWIKWLAVFVNGVHWFNPFAYLLCANVGEACEISCDTAVTKNMTPDEQRLYMKTILDLAG